MTWSVYIFFENSRHAPLVSNIAIWPFNQNIILVIVEWLLQKHLDHQGTLTAFPTSKQNCIDWIYNKHGINQTASHPSLWTGNHPILNNSTVLFWSISLIHSVCMYVCFHLVIFKCVCPLHCSVLNQIIAIYKHSAYAVVSIPSNHQLLSCVVIFIIKHCTVHCRQWTKTYTFP